MTSERLSRHTSPSRARHSCSRNLASPPVGEDAVSQSLPRQPNSERLVVVAELEDVAVVEFYKGGLYAFNRPGVDETVDDGTLSAFVPDLASERALVTPRSRREPLPEFAVDEDGGRRRRLPLN